LENGNGILGLSQVLNEMRRWFGFAFTFVIRYFDELIVVLEASVGDLEFWRGRYQWQVT
jgi:hypothetical protein